MVANAAPWTDQMPICICDICAFGATGMAPERDSSFTDPRAPANP